ncbi:MAG: serine/threonine protein kinase [Chloracidobacterium sp.]|nr:serine/threonine protein kinase [Chloracidobacterium sp.]
MFREGQQIGPYALVSKLGKGGFGEVWLAEKKSQFLTKRVAVKLPHDEQVNFDAISREAMLWEEASGHPNVLPIIDADVYDGQVVMVSEYADGGSLADKLKGGKSIPIAKSVEITLGILHGLEYLHRKRIIHRDIKPENILIQGDTPRLADFGISRAMQTTGVSSTIIGTYAYMSPEAFDGKRTVQTDIWSVGVVLYQLLTGKLPFPQEHPSERMFAVMTKDFAPLPRNIPGNIVRIVNKALQKLPENRYASAISMADELSRLVEPVVENRSDQKTEILDSDKISNPRLEEDIRNIEETVLRPDSGARLQFPAGDVSVATKIRTNFPLEPQSTRPLPVSSSHWRTTLIRQPFVIGVAALFLLGLVIVVVALWPEAKDNTQVASNGTGATNVRVSPFCRGFIDGWNAGYNSVKDTGVNSNITCPDEKQYPDRSYEGGRLTGYSQGVRNAKDSVYRPNSNVFPTIR